MSEQGPRPSIRIEIRDPAGVVEPLTIGGVVEVGRESGDIIVSDPSVSRRHLRLELSGDTLIVTDLGSSHGTLVNGRPISAPTTVGPGDEIRIGDTTITPVGSPPVAVPPVTAPNPGFESLTNDAVEVRYQPGTHGERVARSFAARALKARRQMTGFGSEGWGAVPVVNLVDPFVDPDDPTRLVTDGSIVDGGRGEAWVVVTPEAPPEDPHRVLALLFGAAFPSADEMTVLLEGYGLHLAGAEPPDARLAGADLPSFADAPPTIRADMAVSFVRHLLDRGGDDLFRRCLAAPEGQFDAMVREGYGAPLLALEADWRMEAVVGQPPVTTGQFLRLSLSYLRPYKARQAEIFVYMLLSLAFTSALPFVTRQLFDSAIPNGEFGDVVQLLLILGIAFVITLVAGVRQAYQTAWVSGAVTRDIRQAMFDRLQHLPTAWYQRYPQGDVLSRLFNDVGQVQAGLSDTIGQGIFQALTLVVSAVILLTLNVPLGAIVLLGAPLVAIVYRRMSSGAQTRSMAVQENSGALLTVAAENHRANPVVKVFGLGNREKERFSAQAGRLFLAQRRMSLFGGIFGLSVNLIVTVLRLVIMGFGAWLILEGRFTVGGLVAFLGVMGEVLSPVTVLTNLGQDLQASMGSLVRINEILETEPESSDETLPALGAMKAELRLTDVSFSYTPERRALDQVNVHVPAGSRVAFVGPSGSGKSTVLRILMRMYDPDEGSLTIDGVDVRERSLDSWREQLGVVFQDSFLFDTSLRENIALGRLGASEEEILAAARGAEIDDFAEQLPLGYDSPVGEEGGNLSGGQRQRVAIARALLRNPRLLLLDEATSALDPQTERQINETLRRVSEERTVVAITHRLTSVVDFDKIFVIVDGGLAEEGTHEDLLAQRGVYARLWAEQTGAVPPEEAPFDVAEALERIPLFRGLDRAVLAGIADRTRRFGLDPGEVVADGGGLLVITDGRAEVVAGAGSADESVTAGLVAGDSFGLTSALGGPATTSLRAITPVSLLLLGSDELAAITAEQPSVAQNLTRGTGVLAVPANAVRLTHVGLRPAEAPLAAGAGEGPADHPPRRATGRFTRPTS